MIRDAMRNLTGAALLLAVLAPAPVRAGNGPPPAQPPAPPPAVSDIGVVVLHGMQGNGGRGNIASLVRALGGAGYRVRSPDLCWSRERIYDALFPDCLREIDAAIAALHAAGARRIVVAGQSLGGLATLVYAAQHPDLDGAIAFAPGGLPHAKARNPEIAKGIAEATKRLGAGQGDERAGFPDSNTGKNFTVTTTPAIYLSFVGPGAATDFTAALPQIHVPLLWVAGLDDRSQDRATLWFHRVPANPLNRLVQVQAGHLDTPQAGTPAALDWLQTLPAR